MSKEKPSKAEQLREWISKKLDVKADLASLDGRKKDFEEFEKLHPNEKFAKEQYLNILKTELKKKRIDPRSYGLSKTIPSFKKQGSDMKVTNEPSPQPQPASPPSQQKQAPQGEQKPATQEELKEQIPKDFAMHYTEENVGVTIKALYMSLRAKWKYLEDLNDEEKKTLGELWLPFFEYYLKTKWAIVVIPLLATIGMITPKIQRAQKIQKEKEPDKEKSKKGGESQK